MQIKFKKLHKDAVIPTRAHESDAGFDITCVEWSVVNDVISYKTGLAISVPSGYFGDLRPRSSIYKTGLSLCNSCGTLDSGYTGEIVFNFYPLWLQGSRSKWYKTGDRIGQIIIRKLEDVEFIEVDNLDKSERGDNGFGSTGK